MSSLLDVPAPLALVLHLAVTPIATEAPPALALMADPPAAGPVRLVPQPLAGPMRFSEGMWLTALKEGAAGERYAARIFRTSGGRYYVPAEAERLDILRLRESLELSGRVARSFADSNARRLRAVLRRAPTVGDVYLAHLFGVQETIAFIRLVEAKPDEDVARHLPELSQALSEELAANGGTPLTLAQVYRRLTERLGKALPNLAMVHGRTTAALRLLKPTVTDARASVAAIGAEPSPSVWRAEVSLAATPAQ